MDSQHNLQPFVFPTPYHQHIYDLLTRVVSPGIAAFYRDAVYLMYEDVPLATKRHLVSHLLREIESALRAVIVPQTEKSSEKTPKESSHKAQVTSALEVLDLTELRDVRNTWIGLAEERSLHAEAHRRDLEYPRCLDNEFEERWDAAQRLFYAVAGGIQARFFDYVPRLDILLNRAQPTKEDIRLLKGSIPNVAVVAEYFFERLNHPQWIAPLRKAGFFDHPPSTIRDGDYLRYPPWPQSKYLLRMASMDENAAKLAQEVILRAPDTDNIFIHDAFLRAAMKMPAPLAADIAHRACDWLGKYEVAFPEEYANLAVYLLRNRETAIAMQLTRQILHLRSGKESKELGGSSRPQPEARFPIFHYQEALNTLVPALVQHAGIVGLELLCNLLHDTIRISYNDKEKAEEKQAAYYWYRSLSDDPYYSYANERELMIVAVRNVVDTLVDEGKVPLREIVAILKQRQWHTFTQIEKHVLQKAEASEIDLIVPHLLHYTTFDGIEAFEQDEALLRIHFPNLSRSDQDTIIGWISRGQNRKQVKDGLTRWFGREATNDEIENELLRWRAYRIGIIEPHVPDEKKKEFGDLLERYKKQSESEDQSSPVYGTITAGDNSSISNVGKLDIPAVIELLTGLKFDDSPRERERQNVSEHLRRDVEKRPAEYARDAIAFIGLIEPSFINAVIDGLHTAVRNKESIPWKPVMELCKWVITQRTLAESEEITEHYREPKWTWTHSAIANLFETGFSTDLMPIHLKDSAWQIIIELAQDNEAEPEPEPKEDDYLDDSLTLSLNRIKGKAFHAVFEYAAWVWRNTEELPDKEITPEAKLFMEQGIQNNASCMIQAVYGLRYPQIVAMDKELAARWADVIYPKAKDKQKLFIAAWNAYISHNNAYDNVFKLLHGKYEHAVSTLSPISTEGKRPTDAERRLGQHLMIFYARGLIDVGRDSLLARFYEHASGILRKDTMSYVGHNLVRGAREWADDDFFNRLQLLWEWRIERFEELGVKEDDKPEISSFGWWFGSGEFPESWAIQQLNKAIDLANGMDADDSVIYQLVEVQDTHLDTALDCLAALIDGIRWRERWLEQSCKLLERGLSSEATHDKALSIINKAAAAGHIDAFRDLWNRRNELLDSEE